ncbi:MAG: hypothetical protein R3F61_29775 [Myxococcota bacterium]
MVVRIALVVWGLLGTVGLALFAWGGEVPPGMLVEGVLGLGALVALWLVVKLPWDLYFAARYVQVSQEESVGRALAVPDAEREEARSLARRLLALCVGLHLSGALLSGIVALFSDGLVGPLAAGAFIVTMAVRPLGAMVHHVRRRLGELRESSRIPRDDARSLDGRVRVLESQEEDRRDRAPEEQRVLAQLRQDLIALEARQAHGRAELDARLAAQDQRHRDDVDRLCREFERSIEKLTSDQALLSGIRAFLALVRETPGSPTVR